MISGVGPRTRAALLGAFGSPEAVLAASLDRLTAVDGVGPKLAGKISSAAELDAEGELALAAANGVDPLTESDQRYPTPLREIHDPPGVLYAKGTLQESDARAVAVVGSRHATRYGLEQAERLAKELARAGVTVVSGLARGVDGAAHRGALAAGGRTIAVLAGGLLKLYPPEHRQLADEITARGCLLSEAPPGMPPLSGAFPQRNRVISGLSLGVVVVEAAERSGALITTRHAADQGREVFAVPGEVTNRMSRGCHALIRDGAKLVASVDDILEELSPITETRPTAANPQAEPQQQPGAVDPAALNLNATLNLNEVELKVFTAITDNATPIDAIVESTGLPVHRVLATVSVLEMRRLVRRVSGALVARV